MIKLTQTYIVYALIALFFGSCKHDSKEKGTDKPLIVTTTGMIADAVSVIADTAVEVVGLMGPGVDPHLYKATQNDLRLLRNADIIFYNGLHLEGKMAEILEKLGRQKPVYPISELIAGESLILSDHATGTYDPHIWFDVSLWQKVVSYIADKLSEHMPKQESIFRDHSSTYNDTLSKLHAWVGTEIQQIPDSQRIMITAHDAFEYFGKAYEVEVIGLQGISTVAEFGLKDVKNMVDLIVDRKLRSVFVETSVPSKSLEAVVAGCRQRGHEVSIGGTLYSDAMGEAGTPEGTYTGMVSSNVRTIVTGLK